MTEGKAMKKALFWDFDGTLIYGEPSFLNALRSALCLRGYSVPDAEIQACLNTGCSWHTPEISYAARVGERWWVDLFAHFGLLYEKFRIPIEEASAINAAFKKEILDPATYCLYPDAKRVLRDCIELGFSNYVLSNNFPELQTVAERLGFGGLIKSYIVSSAIGYEKPRLEIFRYAMNVAGNPDCCYMIGDNPVGDIRGGKSAGMTTILVHQQGDCPADYRYETLLEIPSILER